MAKQVEIRAHKPLYGQTHKYIDCAVCKDLGISNRRHKHFSTSYQRNYTVKLNLKTVDCPVCQDRHLAELNQPRVKAFVGGSTTYNFLTHKDWTGTNGFHVDCEFICGGTLATGQEVWSKVFGTLSRPVDTHTILGINDVKRVPDFLNLTDGERNEVKVSFFMEKVRGFYNLSLEHSKKHGFTHPNEFSISKLLRTPTHYFLPGNGTKQNFGPNNQPKNELIDGINGAIGLFNIEVRKELFKIRPNISLESRAPNLCNLGMMKNSRGKRQHQWGAWREQEYNNKYHLQDKGQVKIVKMVVEHLKINTVVEDGQYYK
jgi:hypothetical protein